MDVGTNDRLQASKVALGEIVRVISTAGASAKGTASGFSIRSRMIEFSSSFRVKNSFFSKSTVHSSMLSRVWNSDAEMCCNMLA
jgi:hypothetical protein